MVSFMELGFNVVKQKCCLREKILTKFEKKKNVKNPNAKSNDENSWENHTRKQNKVVSRDPILEKTQNVLKCSILEHFLNWKCITRMALQSLSFRSGGLRSRSRSRFSSLSDFARRSRKERAPPNSACGHGLVWLYVYDHPSHCGCAILRNVPASY
ncbi:hypothetical protein OUZ56_018831 [Daphnia magna]|uniref:Uncharacterized protein n=1 Tax=Daphnia magna TaxID=35525 RepID=A0ABQ9ZB09_9CRUS|nr:hypothetical protein OUZ56_018831 [Daphnia magna]